jgi:hypothetical protein
MSKKERHGNLNFEHDFVFDTNTVRALGDLTTREWIGVYESCQVQGLVAGWAPWVILELTGTNLRRKRLTEEDLRDLIVAAHRYDQLCDKRIVPEPYQLMWTSIHELAEVAIPPFPVSQDAGDLRDRLELFVSLKSTEQVCAGEGSDRDVILKRSDLRRGWGITIPDDFVDYAMRKIEVLRAGPACQSGASRHDVAWEYFIDWLAYTTNAMGVPMSVRQAVVDKGRATDDHILMSPFLAGLIEGWYMAERALGLASAVRENDGADIAIASYLSVSALLITDDGRLRHLASGLVDERERGRIKTFREFRDDVAVPVWRPRA